MKVALANDHAGLPMRQTVIDQLKSLGHEILDFGTAESASVDYPEYAEKASRAVAEGKAQRAVLICGSGVGMSIAANKVPGIRAALITDSATAELSRKHNDLNVLSLRGRDANPEETRKIVDAFFKTDYEAGRHQKRLDAISKLDGSNRANSPAALALYKAIDERASSHPVMVALLREVLALFPPVAPSLLWLLEPDGRQTWDDAEHHLPRLLEARRPDQRGIRNFAKGFVKICAEYVREQAYLVQHGQYRQTSNDELIEELYHNDAEMSVYVDAIFASQFLWQNHYRFLRFYQDEFIPRAGAAAREGPHKGLEIGPGHGLYFSMHLLEQGPGGFADALDVSPASIALTTAIVKAYGIHQAQYKITEGDARKQLPFETAAYSYSVCGELLEHIENPGDLMAELRRCTRKGGVGWMTTVIAASARDHIYLFKNNDEILDMLKKAGWTVEKQLVVEAPTADWLRASGQVPMNCGYILR